MCQDQGSAECKRYSGVDYSTSVACVAPGATSGTGAVHQWVCNQGASNAPATGQLVVQFWDGSTHSGDDLHQGLPKGGDWLPYFGKCTVDLAQVTLNSTGCVDVFDPTVTGVTCVNSSGGAWVPGTALLSRKFVAWVNDAGSSLTEGSHWNNVGGAAAPPNCSPAVATAPACPTGYTCTGSGMSSYCRSTASCTTTADCMGGAICTGSPKRCNLIQPICGTTGAAAGTPLAYDQSYAMTCPIGFRGEWDLLAYNASVPAGASVAFAVQTATASSGPWTPATAGPPPGLLVATAPTDHPGACTMTGPTPCGGTYGASCTCPIDINTPLAAASAGAEANPFLRLNVRLTPSCTGGVPTFSGSAAGFGGSPPGFTSKGVCGANANGSPITAGCANLSNCPNNPRHYSKWDSCQFDYRCDESFPNGKCVQNQPGDKWPLSVCPVGAGPDLTVGPSCTIDGEEGFPVCNRGNDPLAMGEVIEVYISNGNSWDWPTSAGGRSLYRAPTCNYTTTAPLQPGACVFLTQANSGCDASGNSLAYINSRQRIKECGMTGWVAANYTNSAAAARPTGNTPGTSNNNADIKKGNGACQTTGGGSGSPPTLSNWQVTYSCIPTE